MVVDDEPDILHMVRIYLERWNFTIDVFNNPLEALAHFKNHAKDYSLMLTDIRMPEMSGLELATLILRVNPEAKIILMTAFEISPHDLETKLPVIKWDDILHKPFRLAEVCNAVKKQLQIT